MLIVISFLPNSTRGREARDEILPLPAASADGFARGFLARVPHGVLFPPWTQRLT